MSGAPVPAEHRLALVELALATGVHAVGTPALRLAANTVKVAGSVVVAGEVVTVVPAGPARRTAAGQFPVNIHGALSRFTVQVGTVVTPRTREWGFTLTFKLLGNSVDDTS